MGRVEKVMNTLLEGSRGHPSMPETARQTAKRRGFEERNVTLGLRGEKRQLQFDRGTEILVRKGHRPRNLLSESR